MERIATTQRTKALLKTHGLQLKKSLGQHFMADQRILQQMLSAVPFQTGDAALEIGPGIGALTQYLAEKANPVVAVEIDQRLVPVLREQFQEQRHVSIVQQDFLQTDLNDLQSEYFTSAQRVHVVANLPYYITTPILMKLLESNFPWQTITIMIQKEVADRISASPGGKEYGSLTVATQFYAMVEHVCNVPPTAFVPPPNVESAVIRLTRRDKPPVAIQNPERFFQLVRACFAHRRKTLLNNLQSAKGSLGMASFSREQMVEWIERAHVSPESRAEALPFEAFARLSTNLEIF